MGFNPFAAINPVGLFATAISGGLDYYNAKKNREAAQDANEANINLAREQMAAQKEYAQHGVRWRVDDAVAAGLHPLVGAGVQPSSYSPVSAHVMPEYDDRAGALSRMGQNISRAVMATASQDERMASRLRLENMELQNDLLRAQISSINNPNNPPMPVGGSANFVDGQGDSGVMVVKPSERTASAVGRPAQEAGWRPDVSYSRTDTGLVPVIPQGLSESMEDDFIGKLLWRMRNQVMPNVGRGGKPSKAELPRGANDWEWNKRFQEWRPVYHMKWDGKNWR